jgi:hypothetical protein
VNRQHAKEGSEVRIQISIRQCIDTLKIGLTHYVLLEQVTRRPSRMGAQSRGSQSYRKRQSTYSSHYLSGF